MKTIKQHWLDFRGLVIPKDAPSNQVTWMRDAFYAGAMANFHSVVEASEIEDVDEAESCFTEMAVELDNWKNEGVK